MGRPANSKNGTTSAKNGRFRATKATTKMSVPKSQCDPTRLNMTEKNNSTGKADRAQINFPYDIRVCGFSSIINAATKGSPRVKQLLTDECDYIMECRVCRNLFRSLPNFLTHKQTYCKKAFDATWSIGLSNLIQSSDSVYDLEYEVDPELLVVDNDKYNANNPSSSDTTAAVISDTLASLTSLRQTTNSRSTTNFYDELSSRLQKSKKSSSLENRHSSLDSNSEQSSPIIERIRLGIKPLAERPCGTIVLQQRILSDPSNCDIKSAHMNPIETAHKDTAILGPDGKVIYTGPSKGIETVVSKLTAKLQTMESSCSSDPSSFLISCETCKTVFDSDKALRQHRRESLDCGQIWGFKSPVSGVEKSESTECASENSVVPNKRLKFSENALSKCFSYVKTKRNAHKSVLQNPRKKSLSPVKKIKKKYSKLDSTCVNEDPDLSVIQSQDNSLSCNSCSKRFGTKHEMSLHLALCNGVINYALLRNSEPAEEKIRISVRNNHDEFKMSSASISSSNKQTENGDADCIIPVSSNESQVNSSPESSVHAKMSKQLPTSLRGDAAEVNNNKQYENGYCSRSENKAKTVDEDGVTASMILKCTNNTREDEIECDKRSGTISTDSGISTDSVAVACLKNHVDTSVLNSKKLKSPKKPGSKPPGVVLRDQVTDRLEKSIAIRRNPTSKKPMKLNLRKGIAVRLRKSGRMLRASKIITGGSKQ